MLLICPKCKSEYMDGYTICSDCNCDLIEKPVDDQEDIHKKGSKINRFILVALINLFGFLIIFFSPRIAYKLTSMYFIPNGSGQYIEEHFIWMLNAYHYSLLLIGAIICLSCLYWHKNNKG